MRESGILLHISSLPSPGGIGCLGREAYQFADALHESGITIWQVLPVGPTGYGESPYQSPSTFAGNPLFISVDRLAEEGFLDPADLQLQFVPTETNRVDFESVRSNKELLLRTAYAYSKDKLLNEVQAFRKQNFWVEDYALFISVKHHFDDVMWTQWPDIDIRLRKREAIIKYKQLLKEEIEYHIFVQYLFDRQWKALKQYCNQLGIRIFGDIPIYVAEDSADTWTHPEVFQLDKNRIPKRVAGVPPDLFSEDGQLWGNPLYRWTWLRLHGYQWWVNRMQALAGRYDLIRVDHFIGFANYYSVKYGSPNAKVGKWIIGPQHHLFKVLNRKIPGLNIVAEDLGCVNDRVRNLLRFCGYPGMKVLSFAFGGDHSDNPHYPDNYTANSVAYTGTHDNDTVLGLVRTMDKKTLDDCRNTLRFESLEEAPSTFISYLFNSVPDKVIVPMQDFLSLGGEARMNLPGTTGGNWGWRMEPGAFDQNLINRIQKLNKESKRGGMS